MAKRKLSAEQRVKLRAELAEAVKAKRRTPEVLEEISKKYGITTITARWYLKTVTGGKSAKRKGKRPGRPPGSKNGLPKIIDSVHSLAMETVVRAKKAQRLVPKWSSLMKRESGLKKLIQKAQQQLQRVTRRVKTMGSKIRSLVGG